MPEIHRMLRAQVATLLLFTLTPCATAAPHVEFELLTEAGFPLAGHQPWLKLLQSVGVRNIRIAKASRGDRPEIDNVGSADAPSYRITGLLRVGNKLQLEGGTFGVSDKAGLTSWLEKLQDDGIESLTEPTGPFGLSAKRLIAVSEALAKPISFSTQNRPCYKNAVKIAQGLTLKFEVDPVAKRMLESDEVFGDELQGLSSGTALAAVIRPLGLVLVPRREQGQELRLHIVRSRDAKESWPIGWPPQQSPGKTLPDLFRSLNVEIDGTPLPDALAAIKQRVNVPFVFDYNSMARHQIEPANIPVTLPRKKSFYNSIVRDLLRQAKLKHELRVDDAGKPFLWISSLKP